MNVFSQLPPTNTHLLCLLAHWLDTEPCVCLMSFSTPHLAYLYHDENMHSPGWFWTIRNLKSKVGVAKQIEMEMGDPQHKWVDRGHATSPIDTFQGLCDRPIYRVSINQGWTLECTNHTIINLSWQTNIACQCKCIYAPYLFMHACKQTIKVHKM